MSDELQDSNGDDSAIVASPWRIRCIISFLVAVVVSVLAGIGTMAVSASWIFDGMSSCGPAWCLYITTCFPFALVAILLGGGIGALVGRSSGDRWKTATYGLWVGAVIGVLLSLMGGLAIPIGIGT